MVLHLNYELVIYNNTKEAYKMGKKLSNKKLSMMFAVGILGCILMAASDWLMIWGDTAFEGNLAWLTLGVAKIPEWRNALAMGFAFPAVILYAVGLLNMSYLIKDHKDKMIYSALTAIGFTPWLCIHLLYTMILFGFSFIYNSVSADLAYEVCEAMFSQFTFVVLLGQVIMLLPFIYLFVITLRKKTVFPKWMCINNPLIIYVVLKAITMIMPDTAFRLAFTNGLMSEAMLIWFIIYIALLPKYRKVK